MLRLIALALCVQAPLDPYVRDVVRDFGARMDDRTAALANSAALQAAIDSWGYPGSNAPARTVTIPAGTLYVGADVSLDRNGVGLRGAGMRRTFVEKGGYHEGSVLRVGMARVRQQVAVQFAVLDRQVLLEHARETMQRLPACARVFLFCSTLQIGEQRKQFLVLVQQIRDQSGAMAAKQRP